MENNRGFMVYGGWQKLIAWTGNAANPIADSSTDLIQNFTLSISLNPSKIKQNSIFIQINMLSYSISSKPTKIKHFSHFTTQKSNFHLTKNSPIISKLSLFISTFTDNDFPRKNSKSYNPNIGGYHKTTRKTIKTVIALSYFYAKIKSNREYIIKNS